MNSLPAIAEAFAYHRSIAPTLGVLLGLALIETMVVHVMVVAIWGWPVAVPIALMDISLAVALGGLLRAIRRYPVTIGDGLLTMRLGRRKVLRIPLDHVAGLRDGWDRAAVRRRGVVNLALANYPKVVVDLATPVQRRGRDVHAVAHRLDDPAAFSASLRRACASRREALRQNGAPG